MKKLLLLLVLLLVFSACSQQPVEPIPTPQPTDETVLDFSMEELQAELDKFETGYFIYHGCERDFEAEGLSVEITNVTLIDKDYATFDINISNDKNTLVLPTKAEFNYYRHLDQIHGYSMQWGRINVKDGNIIVTKYDFDKGCSVIEHYNAENLQLIDTVEMQNSSDLRLLNTSVYKDSYASQYYINDNDTGLMLIDKDGTVKQKIIFDGSYAYKNGDNFNHLYVFNNKDIVQLTDDLILVGTTDLYSLSKGKACYTAIQCEYEEDGTKFVLYRNEKSNSFEPYIAMLYKDGKLTDSFFSNALDIHEGFAHEIDEYEPVQYSFSRNSRVITIVCDRTQLTLTADFDSKTLNGQYNITEDRLSYEYAKSADGRLSLWSGASAGGGDYFVDALVAKDNTTGQLKYLGCPGGMYGGGADWGFFKNGDMYIFGRSEFTVFSSDLNVEQPIFRMSENFPLGKVDEKDVLSRYLFAVQRDPETFGYTVVYTDVPYNYGIKYPEIGTYYEYSCNHNYKVALLDAQGRAYKHIKTDIDVKTSPFGYVNMNMYLQDDGLMHMTTWVKNPGNIYDDFTVDIQTGEITDLLKAKYADEITLVAAKIIQPAADFIRNLKSGEFVDMEKPLDADSLFEKKQKMYAMKEGYNRKIYIEKKAQKYYLDSFAEYSIYPEFTYYKEDDRVYLMEEINGEIWCNTDLCEDIEHKIYDTDTIKVESITGSSCVISVQYHTDTDNTKQTAYYSMCRNYNYKTFPQWVFTSLVI